MGFSYEPWLVALSLAVAFLGSYVGLHMARGIDAMQGMRRRAAIAMSEVSLALGIWTMHFVGMLAVRLTVAIDFLVLPTLASFLVCVLVVGCAVFAVGAGPATARRLTLAALFMGGGIVTMHYLGMQALHASAGMAHDPVFVIAAVAIGVAASGLALWLGFGNGVHRSMVGSAALLAIGISAMHYTAMAGMTLAGHDMPMAQGVPALTPGLLAIVVSVVAFVVCGLFLLTLVPEPEPAAIETESRDEPARGPAAVVTLDPSAKTADPPTLPIERHGTRGTLAAAELIAVQAQSHYTQLFDGRDNWFCPLSISEVEGLLDPAIFARIHRSHIVNLDHVATVRRQGDAGLVTMATAVAYQAPVARARRQWLKQRLEERGAGRLPRAG